MRNLQKIILSILAIYIFSCSSENLNAPFEITSPNNSLRAVISMDAGVPYYSLAFNGIKSGYEKINISVDESSYLLGYSKKKTFMNIHVPFLRNSLLFVGILISLEIIRELPITLILRPFNFETFATTAYISASEDLLEAAAVPSLFLILIATLFIMLTSKYILRENER